MRISDWSSDVCSSDLPRRLGYGGANEEAEMGGAMLPQAPSYAELTARFRWQVPEHYNIGVDACYRWPETDRLALVHLDAALSEARYSLLDLHTLSNPWSKLLEVQALA